MNPCNHAKLSISVTDTAGQLLVGFTGQKHFTKSVTRLTHTSTVAMFKKELVSLSGLETLASADCSSSISAGAKSKVKSSAQRAIRSKVIETYPKLEPYIEDIMPKKEQLDLVKLYVTLFSTRRIHLPECTTCGRNAPVPSHVLDPLQTSANIPLFKT